MSRKAPEKAYPALIDAHLEELRAIVGREFVLTDEDALHNHSHDYTEDLRFLPQVVVRPDTAEQVAAILRFCNRTGIPATPRGAGTGLSGGALPVLGGVVIAMDRFNRILSIDERNLQATVEPGVINQVFQDAVMEKGLFYPPDPASRGSCFLGGNLAECAGGPKAVKYGVTKDYVLNCQVVLPSGEIIWTGANVLKNSTGYNLTQLLIGSEGTLGIITRIVFRLVPLPKENLLMLVPFRSAEKACEAVSAIFRTGITPSALEFMERDCIEYVMRFVDVKVPLKDDINAHLLIEVDGNDRDVLFKECERISEVLYEFECDEILFADTTQQKADLWKARRSAGEAVKSHSIYKEEDTVVPRAELPRLLKGVKAIGTKYGFRSVCYGHAGDGNLHVNIIKEEMSDEAWQREVPKGIREIFELCVSLGGTISGEHGIGYVQKQYMDIPFDPVQLELMKGIKRLFDPNGILNPGKIFPDA
ncbi:MAG: FAD-binding oxidoreductase [Bacteroidota bacterium]|jgi:glycolate oxidase|uniref:FAD-binding oxidoreductase n=1 Tax=Candidatus Pollutiaquabacter sp. TaxID=3416354 RepID=UPI002C4AF1CD|nr:FAD-binding protein [Bacteroidota bacterium]HRI40411.1 FAD-linked oxidase C-terminal domain-containing protein [Bacteroidia bacterium]HRU60394.1 FAD-linked oxidase C-terminal domain-containing protein [Bacteroidia bacterium]